MFLFLLNSLKNRWHWQISVFLINVKTLVNSINWDLCWGRVSRKTPRSLKCKVISQFACKMTQIVITFSHAKFAASKTTSNGERKKPHHFFLQSLSQWNRSLLKTGLCSISFFIYYNIKIKAISGSTNDSEKSISHLKTIGYGGPTRKPEHTDTCTSYAVNMFLM